MKAKAILPALLMGVLLLLATSTFAQTSDTTKAQESERRMKEKQDKQRLDDAGDLKRHTRSDAKIAKANAKEANRIENDASDAAKEAKQAARSENKAQKMREKADKQARKAAKASEKSNNN